MSIPLPRTTAVLVAAGQSSRMGAHDGARSSVRKPYLLLEGQSLVEHVCEAFAQVAAVLEIVIVGHAEDLERLERMRTGSHALRKVRRVVAGGELRTDSVHAGVRAASEESELVAIHDVARPLIRPQTIERALEVASRRGAALVAIPMSDTVKTSSDGVHVESTLDRSVLWCAQTPQVFRRARFLELVERARREGFRPTDDCAIWEKYAGGVEIVSGEPSNLKITTPEDLVLAEAILSARRAQATRKS